MIQNSQDLMLNFLASLNRSRNLGLRKISRLLPDRAEESSVVSKDFKQKALPYKVKKSKHKLEK